MHGLFLKSLKIATAAGEKILKSKRHVQPRVKKLYLFKMYLLLF